MSVVDKLTVDSDRANDFEMQQQIEEGTSQVVS
jgi:hypothetical protein